MKTSKHRLVGVLRVIACCAVGSFFQNKNAQAFGLVLSSAVRQHRVATPCRQESRLRLSSTPHNEEEPVAWTMEQDWALMDQLPHFTVGEDAQRRTFWSQLCASTPHLSRKESSDLMKRCQRLQNNATEQQTDFSKKLIYGPSPPLLQNWQIDLDRRDGKAMGQTEDGRTIWLRYHCIGRLKGDPLSDLSNSVLALVPGGYLEAVGGRIYELGEPRLLLDLTTGNTPMSLFGNQNVNEKSSFQEKGMAWWLSATTGTMSALLASTVLSACIGYGAGLGIIADKSGPHHASSAHGNHFVTATMRPTIIAATKSSSSDIPAPSLAERRSQAEYRVLREQRLSQAMSERLTKNQAELDSLRQQEQQWTTNNGQLLP